MEYTLAEHLVELILSDLEVRPIVGDSLGELDDDTYYSIKESLVYLVEDHLKGVML